MRKFLPIFLVILVLFSFGITYGATKEDVISAINATYSVGEETYRLPQSIINKATDAINKRKLTSKQCDKALGLIDSVVSIAQRAGTTDITKISKEDLQEGLSIIKQATGAAKIDIGSSNLVPSANNNSNSDNLENNNATSPNNNEISGDESISGKGNEASGDLLEDSFDIISLFLDSSGEKATKVEETVDTHSKIAIFVLILFLFLNIFIIYLLFKSKWNKIAKYILIIIFVILFLSTLFVLGVGLHYIEELKIIYKLYYMLK